jgi:hypothetical protein
VTDDLHVASQGPVRAKTGEIDQMEEIAVTTGTWHEHHHPENPSFIRSILYLIFSKSLFPWPYSHPILVVNI